LFLDVPAFYNQFQHAYPNEYEGHFDSLMIPSYDLQSRIRDIAIRLRADFQGKRPVLICTLKGACPFFGDLCRELSKLRQGYDIEFLRASSYDGTSTTGVVTMVGELKLDALKNRHVVVVEDIVDTGTTLAAMIPVLEEHGKPASIAVCSLLDKRLSETKKYSAKYCGFSIPDYFIVGYGKLKLPWLGG
jgi:hypoxanthine phosphoribosyltransferase